MEVGVTSAQKRPVWELHPDWGLGKKGNWQGEVVGPGGGPRALRREKTEAPLGAAGEK